MIYRRVILVIAFMVTILVLMPVSLIFYFLIKVFYSIYLVKRFLKKRL